MARKKALKLSGNLVVLNHTSRILVGNPEALYGFAKTSA